MRCVCSAGVSLRGVFGIYLLYATRIHSRTCHVPRGRSIRHRVVRNMKQAKFSIGQCVCHKLFDYRGVIVDVDPDFQGTEAWYEAVAKSRPPKNEPWYRVLVHNADHETYVAERNLTEDPSGTPVNHPLLDEYFVEFDEGIYMTGWYDS